MHPSILRAAAPRRPRCAVALALAGACSDGSPTQPDRVAALVLGTRTGALVVGDTLRVPAEVRDRNGRPVAGVALAWQSSDEQVAGVTPDGAVIGRAAGRAVIRARAGGVADSAVVQVADAAVAAVEVPGGPAVALVRYEERQLAAVARDARGRPLPGAPSRGRAPTRRSSRSTPPGACRPSGPAPPPWWRRARGAAPRSS
jgi:hypothetical protein